MDEIEPNVMHGDLYDEMVTNPANEIINHLDLSETGRARLISLGLDPDKVLGYIKESAYEDIKESLRPAFEGRAHELGISA